MSDTLLKYVNKVIGHIELDEWGSRGAPKVKLSENTHWDSLRDSIIGSIEIHVPNKQGEFRLFHTEDISGVLTEEQFKDYLAEALSTVLAKHQAWPKK